MSDVNSKLAGIRDIGVIANALNDGQSVPPTFISSSAAFDAMQMLFQLGEHVSIERDEPLTWRWADDRHDHYLMVEHGEGDALSWVFPKDAWPSPRWLLEELRGLVRVEIVIETGGWPHTRASGERATAYRREAEKLKRWLDRHEEGVTHFTVTEGEGQGLFDRFRLECRAGISFPDVSFANGFWESEADWPVRGAPYVRGEPLPWSYQKVERWTP